MPEIEKTDESIKGRVCLLLTAAGAVALLFLWEGRDGFNLWDEGFLWYGAQRVLKGEVPIRDFLAYDPLRYYWSAFWMRLADDTGVIALRGAVALFQVFGLAAGLAVAGGARSVRTMGWGLLVTTVLLFWMFPRHKIFDASVSLLLIALLAAWLANPSRRWYFTAGVGVGLAAVLGRNHGVYGAAGSILTMTYLHWARPHAPERGTGPWAWLGGVAVGYLPMIAMTIFVPGFAKSLWSTIQFLFEIKATNLPLPVPWPWRASLNARGAVTFLRSFVTGGWFVAALAFGVAGPVWAFWRQHRRKPPPPNLIAAAFLALPYAHYALSRADVGHLALGIFPLLVGGLAWLGTQPAWCKWTGGPLMAAAGLLVILPMHPGWQKAGNQGWSEAEVVSDRIWVDPGTAGDLALLQRARREVAPQGGRVLSLFWPGGNCILEQRSPTWEIYPLLPRSEEFQKDEIRRIEADAPNFVIMLNLAIDGRDELRYQYTHPLIYRYVTEHFERVKMYSPNPDYLCFRGKGTPP